jgi:Rod binding domain-containing protein
MDTPPAAAATAATPDPRFIAKARRAAESFEAQALGSLLQPMFEGLNARGPFGGGQAEEMWRPMLVTELGKQLAGAGGIGLADAVLRQMLKLQEGATA